MNRPTVMLMDQDNRYGEKLNCLSAEEGWEFRQPGNNKELFRQMSTANPGLFVIRAGKDIHHELSCMDRTSRLFFNVKTIVITDYTQEALANLGWQLGATLVLPSSQSTEQILFSLQYLMRKLLPKETTIK